MKKYDKDKEDKRFVLIASTITTAIIAMFFGLVYLCVSIACNQHNNKVAQVWNEGTCPQDNVPYDFVCVSRDGSHWYVCPECHTEVNIYK